MSGVSFEPVRPVRLYERIVGQVEAAVASGELTPGSRLPSERELVTQFDASRATVREALRVLEANGVVRSRPGDPRGPEVLPFTPYHLTRQVRRLTESGEMSLTQLLASRMILDSSASRLAAVLRTDDEYAAMRASIERMREGMDDGFDAFSEADYAFHELVAQASRNPLLQVCNQVVRETVLSLISDKIAHADNAPALMEESLRSHETVLDAIGAGDGDAAAAASVQSLYDYYADHVPAAERPALQALLPS